MNTFIVCFGVVVKALVTSTKLSCVEPG